MEITSRKLFEKWKRNKSEYLSVITVLLRESKYLCPKCLTNLDISTAHCSHIVSCKTLDKYKAFCLATNINNLTVCCKTCNLKQGSKTETDLISEKLLVQLKEYNFSISN